MEYHTLGRTGLKVSNLCLGTMQWGWTANKADAHRIMDTFVAYGGNFLDSADFYSRWIPGNSGGEAETIIGAWLKTRGQREKIILATKVYQPMSDDPNSRGLSRKHIIEGVEASLHRLQTDYIDLYQAHAFDPDTSIDETLHAFEDLQRSGKVRYIGASNFPAWRIVEALWSSEVRNTPRFETLEPHYNLAYRAEFERDLQEVCTRYQLGVIPYSPLANGFLTGKYTRTQTPPGDRSESVTSRYNNERSWNTLEAVQTIADEIDCPPAAVAIAWLQAQPAVTAPIIGVNSLEQLETNLQALDIHLTREQVARLNEVSAWQNN